MKDEINYKELWFKVCEEKKQLQLENHTLKTNYDYICKKFSSLEKIHSSLIQSNWNKHAPHLNSASQVSKADEHNKDLEVSALPTPKESQKAIPSLNHDINRNKLGDL